MRKAPHRFPTLAVLLTLAFLLSLPTAGTAMMSRPDAVPAPMLVAAASLPSTEQTTATDTNSNGTTPATDTVSVEAPTPVFCYVVVDHVAHYAGVMHFPSRSAALALTETELLPLPVVPAVDGPVSAAGDISGALQTADNDAVPAGDLCCFIVPNDSVCLVVMVNRPELGSGQLIAARWYDPQTGRFISRDPVEATVADLDYNPYSYCRNNPLKYVDNSGMTVEAAREFVRENHDAIVRHATDYRIPTSYLFGYIYTEMSLMYPFENCLDRAFSWLPMRVINFLGMDDVSVGPGQVQIRNANNMLYGTYDANYYRRAAWGWELTSNDNHGIQIAAMYLRNSFDQVERRSTGRYVRSDYEKWAIVFATAQGGGMVYSAQERIRSLFDDPDAQYNWENIKKLLSYSDEGKKRIEYVNSIMSYSAN